MILGECEIALLAPQREGTEAERAAFGVIRRRAQRLQRRVEDMLRVARSESGTLELQFRRVSLSAICAGAIEAFEGATKRRDIVLVLDGAADEVHVSGDFEWLRQIVEAAIDNALRYAKGAITLQTGVEGPAATLRIRDDGPGWGVPDPQALLARFARRGGLAASGAAGGGYGIGLSLLGWVVDRHGGTVTLGEAPRGGAEILIRLPLAEPRASRPEGSEPLPTEPLPALTAESA